MEELIKKVDSLLSENHIMCDVYQYESLPIIAVEIHWGDWKHEHKACDWLVEDMGGMLLKEDETETDGSDCYSSIHYFMF